MTELFEKYKGGRSFLGHSVESIVLNENTAAY